MQAFGEVEMDPNKTPVEEQQTEELPLSPNERLAAQIVASLLEKELITSGDLPKVHAALNSGKAKQEDWSGWMNNGIKAKQTK